jgi:hypothetical protein
MKTQTAQHTPTAIANEVRSYLHRIGNSAEAEYASRAVNAHEELVQALKVAYQFFNTEANTPDKDGYVTAPDSMVRVVLRKMNQALATAEGKGE